MTCPAERFLLPCVQHLLPTFYVNLLLLLLGTLFQKAENIVNALELDVLFTNQGNILCDEQEISPKQLVRISEITKKENCTYGAFFRKAEEQGIDLGESFGG